MCCRSNLITIAPQTTEQPFKFNGLVLTDDGDEASAAAAVKQLGKIEIRLFRIGDVKPTQKDVKLDTIVDDTPLHERAVKANLSHRVSSVDVLAFLLYALVLTMPSAQTWGDSAGAKRIVGGYDRADRPQARPTARLRVSISVERCAFVRLAPDLSAADLIPAALLELRGIIPSPSWCLPSFQCQTDELL